MSFLKNLVSPLGPVWSGSGFENLPDLERFERRVFRNKNVLDLLLAFALELLPAKQVGLLLGTDRTGAPFLPPDQWDRGIMHKFAAPGVAGWVWKRFGNFIVRYRGLSPVRLYRENQFGDWQAADGIISFVLRKHQDFYRQGIKILIIDNLPELFSSDDPAHDEQGLFADANMFSYNGGVFNTLPGLRINTRIVRQFRAKNFVCAYIPDYGAIVFNTVNSEILERRDNGFLDEPLLMRRLNMLIASVEMASLAYLGHARGRPASRLIWRKEKHLRKTAQELLSKEEALHTQREYLRAVGAVNEQQINMPPMIVADGVYAFIDMAGSAVIRQKLPPEDYFYILNLCHQISADNAGRYFCRVDNFIGDSVFLVNASPFDGDTTGMSVDISERVMLMIMALASFYREIHQLCQGSHPLDEHGRVPEMIDKLDTPISFRAGMDIGPAMIGPLGSHQRKIVTAIGKAVNQASRLESSGVKYGIHISDRLMKSIRGARITPDTHLIRRAVSGSGRDHDRNLEEAGFPEFFRSVFGIQGDLFEKRENASYKEFTQKISYVINCHPAR